MCFTFKVLILFLYILYINGLDYQDELAELDSERSLFKEITQNEDYTFKIRSTGDGTTSLCDHQMMVVTVNNSVVTKIEFDDCEEAAVCSGQEFLTDPKGGYSIIELFELIEIEMNYTFIDPERPTIVNVNYSTFHYPKIVTIQQNNETDESTGWEIPCISFPGHHQCMFNCRQQTAAKRGLNGKGKFGLNLLYNEDEPWEWNNKIHYIVGILFFVGLCAIGIFIMFCVIMRSNKKKEKKPKNKREKYWFDTDNKGSDVQHKYEAKYINKKKQRKVNDLSDSEMEDSDADQPVPLMVDV